MTVYKTIFQKAGEVPRDHQWSKWQNCECCKVCFVIKRTDGIPNRPCPGALGHRRVHHEKAD